MSRGIIRAGCAVLAALLLAMPAALLGQNLSPLAEQPDWHALDPFQRTITRSQFDDLLEHVYAPRGGWQPYIRLDADAAVIRTSNVPLDDLYTLQFAPENGPATPRPAAYWRPRAAIVPSNPPAAHPLMGLNIVLDPGHLGGSWAHTEERWFQVGAGPPVAEGDLTLQVARQLAARLRDLGARQVTLTRDSDEPTTRLRPPDLLGDAARALWANGITNTTNTYNGPADPNRQFSIAWMSEALFARAEIRARAQRVNEQWHPDLVLCLHFNAEAWGDPAKPELVDKNHFHVLINGCYEPDELEKDDVRLEMLVKLLNGSHSEELAAAEAVAPVVARETGLPPYNYTGMNAIRAGADPYIWERNLLANRLDTCPVVYLEPYVMNSPEVCARVQAGDYEGTRVINGAPRKSIFREYADAVADGLVDYYGHR